MSVHLVSGEREVVESVEAQDVPVRLVLVDLLQGLLCHPHCLGAAAAWGFCSGSSLLLQQSQKKHKQVCTHISTHTHWVQPIPRFSPAKYLKLILTEHLEQHWKCSVGRPVILDFPEAGRSPLSQMLSKQLLSAALQAAGWLRLTERSKCTGEQGKGTHGSSPNTPYIFSSPLPRPFSLAICATARHTISRSLVLTVRINSSY